MRKTTRDFPIKRGYWYIVFIKDLVNVRLYPVYFINKTSAIRALNTHISSNKRGKYQVHGYNILTKYELKYKITLGKLSKFSKYPNIKLGMSAQEKKTHRTVMRRRLRRMGMLIPKKHKIPIGEPIKQARLLINKQWIANSPNTEAKAFRLERKPKHYYYIILHKKRSSKKRIMFEVKALKFNAKTGELKKLLIQIYNRDVILPYLLSEVIEIAKNKGYDSQAEKIGNLY